MDVMVGLALEHGIHLVLGVTALHECSTHPRRALLRGQTLLYLLAELLIHGSESRKDVYKVIVWR